MAASEPEQPRRRYNVGVTKIEYARRDVARRVFRRAGDAAARNYVDVLGSDTPDNHDRFPVGADVAYAVELTDAEAQAFAQASNCRYIEPDTINWPTRRVGRPAGTAEVPTLSTLTYLRARYLDLRRWHGRDVPVAVLDQGTTQAVRDKMGFTLVARTTTDPTVHLGPGQELVRPEYEHGCLVAPNAVPAGGLLLDGIIIDDSGGAPDSAMAAGITWAVDNGAKVINISFAGAVGGTPPQVSVDAATYARTNGVHIVISAGNDNAADLATPSILSRSFANVHSSIAFDEATDRRALFSNHAADASGCGPGVDVTSFSIRGAPVSWNGTSASAPHMCQMLARVATGGTFTMNQVGAAFKANTRNTGQPASEQGAGAYDPYLALVALGGMPATASSAGATTTSIVDTRGGANATTGYNLAVPTTAQIDDVRIAFLVSQADADFVLPQDWVLLTDTHYFAGWERSAGQSVGPTRMRVLAKAYVPGEPDPVLLSFGGDAWWSAVAGITVRAAGGLDPEQFVPTTKFGTGGALDTVPVLPSSTNDLLVCVFSQRHPTATTGTLSLPTGLTQRGFWRPATGTTGYTLLIATAQLSSSARTASYVSTSNDAAGTWTTAALTIPSAPAPLTTVIQSEPAGPAGAFLPFFPAA